MNAFSLKTFPENGKSGQPGPSGNSNISAYKQEILEGDEKHHCRKKPRTDPDKR